MLKSAGRRQTGRYKGRARLMIDLEKAAFSAYCSLILSSALFAAAPQSYQAAAMALPDAAVQAVRQAGWHVSSDNTPASIPDASPKSVAAVSAPAAGQMAKVADYVSQNGIDLVLNGKLCTALGVTQNNENLPVKQKLIDTDVDRQTIN